MIPGKIGARRTCHGGRQGVMDRLKTVEQGGSGKSSQHAVVQSPAASKRVLDDFRPARTSPEAEKRGEITVVIAKSLDEIEALRDIWREMQNNESSAKPNVDMDRFISVLKAGNNAARPHVTMTATKTQFPETTTRLLLLRPVPYGLHTVSTVLL